MIRSTSMFRTARPAWRRLAAPLLGVALVGLLALPALAQKSTIQRSRGGGGGSGVHIGGVGGSSHKSILRSGGERRSAPSVVGTRPASPRSGGISRPTLSPDFPLRGRGGTSQAALGTRSRRDLRVFGNGTDDKRYIRGGGDRSRGRDDWRDHDRRRRRHHSDRDRFNFFFGDPFFFGPAYDPFFSPIFRDPFLRYRHFDRYRYYGGFGCGFYDRYFGFGHQRYDPCFSSFSLYLGWPGIFDPWPGFWSYGLYGLGGGYNYGYGGGYGGSGRYGYREGYEEGYARGYSEGVSGDEGTASYGDAYATQTYGTTSGDGYHGDVGAGYYGEGRESMAQADYASALRGFELYLEEAPTDPAGHLSRGVALVALGHYGKAADAFRRGLDAYAPWQRPAFDAPALFNSRGEFRRVTSELADYVRSHADQEDARFTLAVVYLFSGERSAAESLLRGLGDDPHAKHLLGSMRN